MKKNSRSLTIQRALLIILSVAGVILVAACASPTTQVATSQPPAATDSSVTAAPSGGDSSMSFSSDIQPIFTTNCTRCHGDSRQSGNLMLNTYSGVMAGGRHGAVVLPGKAVDSLLVQKITSGAMPKNGNRLSDAQIKLITDWINAGATDN
jgi:cytochrome c553